MDAKSDEMVVKERYPNAHCYPQDYGSQKKYIVADNKNWDCQRVGWSTNESAAWADARSKLKVEDGATNVEHLIDRECVVCSYKWYENHSGENCPACADAKVAVAPSPTLDELLNNVRPATEDELRQQGETLAKNYKPGSRQARPFAPSPTVESALDANKIRKEFEGAITEIGANKTLVAKDDYNKGWNDASDNAIKFIRNYIAGEGLFQ